MASLTSSFRPKESNVSQLSSCSEMPLAELHCPSKLSRLRLLKSRRQICRQRPRKPIPRWASSNPWKWIRSWWWMTRKLLMTNLYATRLKLSTCKAYLRQISTFWATRTPPSPSRSSTSQWITKRIRTRSPRNLINSGQTISSSLEAHRCLHRQSRIFTSSVLEVWALNKSWPLMKETKTMI